MMDPILFSTTFATIVGLIGQFRSDRGSSEQANFNEFSTWLSTSNTKTWPNSLSKIRMLQKILMRCYMNSKMGSPRNWSI